MHKPVGSFDPIGIPVSENEYETNEPRPSPTQHIFNGVSSLVNSFATAVRNLPRLTYETCSGVDDQLRSEALTSFELCPEDLTLRESSPALSCEILKPYLSRPNSSASLMTPEYPTEESGSTPRSSLGRSYLKNIKRKPASPVGRRPLEKDFVDLTEVVVHPH